MVRHIVAGRFFPLWWSVERRRWGRLIEQINVMTRRGCDNPISQSTSNRNPVDRYALFHHNARNLFSSINIKQPNRIFHNFMIIDRWIECLVEETGEHNSSTHCGWIAIQLIPVFAIVIRWCWSRQIAQQISVINCALYSFSSGVVIARVLFVASQILWVAPTALKWSFSSKWPQLDHWSLPEIQSSHRNHS